MTAGVLVIGASGYIGSAVAKAARRDGFTVYGATRNEANAASLKAAEIRPLICDPKDVDALSAVVERCEWAIDCTADYADPNGIPDACLEAIRRSSQHTKKHYIYTSGGLVHGHHNEPVSEDDVTEHAAWRVAIERRLVATEDVSCTVIRPGFVYGNSGGFYAKIIFSPPKDGQPLLIAGNPDRRWSWVHVDDLAKAYIDVMHRSTVAAGRVYDIGEPFGPTYQEMRLAAAKLAGFQGEIVQVPAAEGMDAMSDVTFLYNGKRARDELGWFPLHTGLMAELPLYYESYKACSA